MFSVFFSRFFSDVTVLANYRFADLLVRLPVTFLDSNFLALFSFFRDCQQFRFCSLLDFYAVDYPTRSCRFELHYHIFSFYLNMRVVIIAPVSEIRFVPSLELIFSSARWLEREVWDLFGVFFSGHSDLRRILTDYGFSGYPLRRDFPLSGFVEVRYDDQVKKVVIEPVEFVQEYRYFDFLSPWQKLF